MKTTIKPVRGLAAVMLAVFLLAGRVSAAETPAPSATAEEPVEIYTVEELLAMAEDPAGSYILMADLDMTGIEWKSLDFTGTFDGNGHAILNLTLSQPGDAKPTSYDGNNKGYETSYIGMFGSLRGAQVKNLQLYNVRAVVERDDPCFLAGIAGYSDHSTISECTVTGWLELRAHDRMFGVAGVIGHGNGTVERCAVDVTLICTDTDSATRDEQFLGGIFATGFVDVVDCRIDIDGYISDHGYVHSGGIAGMYMRYPLEDWKRVGYITGNTVTGKITFFEDNTDRRAYCEAEVGEPLASNSEITGNTLDFQRDERWEYDRELRPDMCEDSVYSQRVVSPTCRDYGYSVFTCDTCGYSYQDVYTLHSDHAASDWTVVEPATLEQEGLSVGDCDVCGQELQRREPKLEPEPTQDTGLPQETLPQTQEPQESEQEDMHWGAVGIAAVLAVACCAGAALLRKKRKNA